ncbi:hypothetical protein RDWZM_009157 [Blomia tropicalis]|uniref:ceramide glucosyltransferase n=1 Tax=Blomia tropicalis TaxID=40697 RepID=A0A9Q0M608_BLOTA|nr:hypothetical protein RDWZM_009157 [Blomia tropicalis]
MDRPYMEYAFDSFSIILITIWSSVWIIHFGALFHATRRLHKRWTQPIFSSATPPSVSILKPLMGVDQNLYSNLESFFQLKYPSQFELLFCIEDKTDPAIDVVNRLIDRYPKVDAKLFVGGNTIAPIGVNPKINNMQPGYYSSKYELLLISDSRIYMKPNMLTHMVYCLIAEDGDSIGLVHQMPFTTDRNSLSGCLEQVFFGTTHARPYLFSDLIRVNCPNGMSTLMRKAVLDEAGGLVAFGRYLAEDFFIAKYFTDNGWSMRVDHQPALQNAFDDDIGQFRRRILRWAQLRQSMLPHMILLEPLGQCFFIGIAAAWSISYQFEWINPFIVFGVHVLCWFICDFILCLIIRHSISFLFIIYFIPMWLLSELLVTEAYLRAVVQPTIRWRGKRYRLRWGGLAVEVPQ